MLILFFFWGPFTAMKSVLAEDQPRESTISSSASDKIFFWLWEKVFFFFRVFGILSRMEVMIFF